MRTRVRPYDRVVSALQQGRRVMLDGGIGTELPHASAPEAAQPGDRGVRALLTDPGAVREVHRSYVAAGCDVISTSTWGILGAGSEGVPDLFDSDGVPVHWIEAARRGIEIAHEAIEEEGRAGECAVAFSIAGEVDAAEQRAAAAMLPRVFESGPRPDLILVETISLTSPSLLESVEALIATGIPVWTSFRRCRHGPCGAFGEHWGGPEGDAFGQVARQLETIGASALLVNCIPPDHVDGMLSYLRDFTDLPLGVYPNLGYATDRGWQSKTGVTGDEYAEMALRWREEGAQIVGGCCGVGPAHIVTARTALEDTEPGTVRRSPAPSSVGGQPAAEPHARPTPWLDARDRPVHPLPFPELEVAPGVQPPGGPTYLAWRHLLQEGIGAHQRCLDVGCGSGLLGIQLALNGAAHVRALDVDSEAVANTLTNAFRNRVDERITATAADLYPWTPEERFDVVVACLPQEPDDPANPATNHRTPGYWGRNLVDVLISKLPLALAPDGVAYMTHLSLLSQRRTSDLLEAHGLTARVVDYSVVDLAPRDEQWCGHIERIEQLSDAFHLDLGNGDAMVAYLLEIRPA